MKAAIRLGSTSYLAFYLCALEEYRTTADAEDRYTRIGKVQAAEIRGLLARSIALMPDFGPSQQLLGFLEMLQGEHSVEAAAHLQQALQLERKIRRIGCRWPSFNS